MQFAEKIGFFYKFTLWNKYMSALQSVSVVCFYTFIPEIKRKYKTSQTPCLPKVLKIMKA